MSTLLGDFSYALRALRKAPWFSAIAILSLTLGIGLNSAVFSLVEANYLRSWPARNPRQLASVVARTPQGEDPNFSYPEYRDLNQQAAAFSGVLAYSRQARFLKLGADARLILVDVVSPNYFSVLGLDPATGKMFSRAQRAENGPSVVLSYELWQREFGRDRSLVGKSVVLSGKPYTVIGVAPPGFRGLERMVPTDAWLPAHEEVPSAELEARNSGDYELIARLRPETTVARAQTEVEIISHRLAENFPATNKGRTFALVTEADRLREAIRPALFLMTAVGLVLLVACANVAGLVLARSEARRQEIAIRTALGGTPGRLLRLLLSEGLLLAFTGAALGLLLTRWLIQVQPVFMPPAIIALRIDMRVDSSVLFFTGTISVAATLIFALAPALGAARPDLVTALKGEGKGARRRHISLSNVLVVGEIAMAMVLLSASGLLVRSLVNSANIRPGFDAERNLVFFSLSPDLAGYSRQRSTALFRELVERVEALPGVKQASFARRALLSGSGGGMAYKTKIPGIDLPSGQQSVNIKFNAVDINYFHTVGAAILEGRGFTPADARPESKVTLIDRTMARRYWPDADPVGKHLNVEGADFEIIGVTEPVRIMRIHETPEPYMYFAFAQAPDTDGTLIVETAGNPRSVIPSIREAVHARDANLPILEVFTATQLMHTALWEDRMSAGLVGALGLAGMFLAAVGLYGVIAWLVSQRTHEMGVRMALGAQPGQVRRLVLGHALKLAAVGMLIGVVAALGLTRLMASFLYGVKTTDPLTFAAACCLIFMIALAAGYSPARRASRVDPMVALRCE